MRVTSNQIQAPRTQLTRQPVATERRAVSEARVNPFGVDGFDGPSPAAHPATTATTAPAKKKKGFFSKLGGFFKKVGKGFMKALPIISTVAMFIPGINFIALPLRLALAAKDAISAIKNGNWLGAIGAVAGGIAGGAGALGAKGLAGAMSVVSKGAKGVENLAGAIKNRSPSGILGSVAGLFQTGAGALASTSGDWSDKLARAAEKMNQWGRVASAVENPVGALAGLVGGQAAKG